jgi:hypothetical protein
MSLDRIDGSLKKLVAVLEGSVSESRWKVLKRKESLVRKKGIYIYIYICRELHVKASRLVNAMQLE